MICLIVSSFFVSYIKINLNKWKKINTSNTGTFVKYLENTPLPMSISEEFTIANCTVTFLFSLEKKNKQEYLIHDFLLRISPKHSNPMENSKKEVKKAVD